MSNSNQTMSQKTLTGIGNLIRLLPTGTVFMFQFLNPVLTNNGQCHTINKYLSGILVIVSAFSCCFASFTDSYEDTTGISHYGIATNKGLWPNSSSQDLSSYRLRFGDFVHAFFSLIAFSVVALLDRNTVECFHPSSESTQKALLMALPLVMGAVSGSIFVMFQNTRHGIGYPSSSSSSSSSAKS
ncbi:protein DMP2-like [Olea europaea subsp. europaea]|uniref:Protein DMP2-like n=1 Tax=Olea europaea subsp. europaea TaxID=158383 RepID=A0A8S0QDH8_OLEEU|nr:protein DMP2-like [Olea europaea subsp. europaea]